MSGISWGLPVERLRAARWPTAPFNFQPADPVTG
jgi:hypothetical protein